MVWSWNSRQKVFSCHLCMHKVPYIVSWKPIFGNEKTWSVSLSPKKPESRRKKSLCQKPWWDKSPACRKSGDKMIVIDVNRLSLWKNERIVYDQHKNQFPVTNWKLESCLTGSIKALSRQAVSEEKISILMLIPYTASPLEQETFLITNSSHMTDTFRVLCPPAPPSLFPFQCL